MRLATVNLNRLPFMVRTMTTFPKYSPYVTKNEMKKIHKSNEPVSAITEITEESTTQTIGIKKFLGRVYGCTGLSIAATLGLAQGLSHYGLAMDYFPHCFGGGILLSFGGLAGIMFTKYKIVKDDNGLRSENQPVRLLSFASFVTGMSLTIAPMVEMCNNVSPTILPIATGLSLFTMGGASLFAYMRPTDSLLAWKAPLFGGLIGLVGVSFTALIGSWILGMYGTMSHTLILGSPAGFGTIMVNLLHNVDLYGGILLFTGLTAYDTHVAIDMYKRGDPDHLGISTDLYLDFMNLLIRIMEIVGKSKQD